MAAGDPVIGGRATDDPVAGLPSSQRRASRRPVDSRAVVVAAVVDLVCILVFVAIGRASHKDGVTFDGMASTAWPFVVGAGCGWAAIRAWHRPLVVVPTGVTVWFGCVAVGMVLRVVAGQGTAVAFVIVALAFLGLFLLGWRGLVALVADRMVRARSAGSPTPAGAADGTGTLDAAD